MQKNLEANHEIKIWKDQERAEKQQNVRERKQQEDERLAKKR